MEKRRPEHEFAPGITDPEVFAKMVSESPWYHNHLSEVGKERMENRMGQIDRLLETSTFNVHRFESRLKKQRVGYLTERAILEVLLLENAFSVKFTSLKNPR